MPVAQTSWWLSELVECVRVELSAYGLLAPHLIGPEYLAQTNAPARFIWVPAGGTYEGSNHPSGNPNAVALAKVNVEVTCWGKDYGAAWNLQTLLVRALRRLGLASLQAASFKMGEPAPREPSREVIVTFWILVPITDTTLDEATLEDYNHSAVVEHLDGSVSSETGC